MLNIYLTFISQHWPFYLRVHVGMCKRHYNRQYNPRPSKPDEPPLQPTGQSVYDDIIPASVAWKVPKKRGAIGGEQQQVAAGAGGMLDPSFPAMGGLPPLTASPPAAAAADRGDDLMPIVAHFRKYAHLEAGWHRKQERAARGLPPPPGKATQLETWERQREYM